MRGIDVLTERPYVDAKRIILLGAVAGGGDPAAVTAVLGFAPGTRIARSEYGLSRVLSRDEQSEAAAAGRRRGWAYVTAFEATAPNACTGEPASVPLPDGLVPVGIRQAA